MVINAMIWDHMVVAMMGLGAWVCVHAFEREKNLSQMVNYTISKQRWLILFAPVSMCLLYIVLYFHFQVPGAHHQSSFNFATLFSPFYYQYTLIYAYYPLADLAVWELAPVALAMGCVLALASGVWVFTSLRTDNHDKTNDEPSWRRLIARTAYLGLLLWGAVSIYALAGGYALDTRKRYAIVALLLLACAGLFAKLMNQKSMRSFLRYLCSMLVVLGIVANWATIFAWNFEARRYHAMLDNVIQAEPQEPFSVRLQPDFRKTNPTMELLWGNDLYRPVKIDQALRFSGVHDVPDVVQDSEHILSYQNQTWEWKQISHE
ncbi:MAG: hypothetical protein CUN55_12445 [Phototrophicales bacterium]|nr:MAG: hypothetical protein CUN55_12445 [Phototrophicales bacterium]